MSFHPLVDIWFPSPMPTCLLEVNVKVKVNDLQFLQLRPSHQLPRDSELAVFTRTIQFNHPFQWSPSTDIKYRDRSIARSIFLSASCCHGWIHETDRRRHSSHHPPARMPSYHLLLLCAYTHHSNFFLLLTPPFPRQKLDFFRSMLDLQIRVLKARFGCCDLAGTPRKALARAGRCGESDDPIPSPTTMTASQASRRPYVPPSPAGNRVVIYEAPPQAPPPLVA